MKVGILSDTHQNFKNLEEAGRYLVEEEGVDILVHLGDDSDDAKILEKFDKKIIVVPGVFEPSYQDPKVKNRIIENFDKNKVLISHTEEIHKNDPMPEVKELIDPQEAISKKQVDMAWVGHTHIPKIEDKQGVFILNPGHLKLEDKKGYPPSFGIVDFEKKIAKIIVLEKKNIFFQKNF